MPYIFNLLKGAVLRTMGSPPSQPQGKGALSQEAAASSPCFQQRPHGPTLKALKLSYFPVASAEAGGPWRATVLRVTIWEVADLGSYLHFSLRRSAPILTAFQYRPGPSILVFGSTLADSSPPVSSP